MKEEIKTSNENELLFILNLFQDGWNLEPKSPDADMVCLDCLADCLEEIAAQLREEHEKEEGESEFFNE